MPDSRKTAARRIEIVPAEERHVKAIGDLWWEFILFHQSIDPIWAPSDDSIEYFIEDHLRKFLGSDDRLALVATDGDTAIGYALAEINRVGHQPRLDASNINASYDLCCVLYFFMMSLMISSL